MSDSDYLRPWDRYSKHKDLCIPICGGNFVHEESDWSTDILICTSQVFVIPYITVFHDPIPLHRRDEITPVGVKMVNLLSQFVIDTMVRYGILQNKSWRLRPASVDMQFIDASMYEDIFDESGTRVGIGFSVLAGGVHAENPNWVKAETLLRFELYSLLDSLGVLNSSERNDNLSYLQLVTLARNFTDNRSAFSGLAGMSGKRFS